MGRHNALQVNWAKIELRFRNADSMAELVREFGVLFWDGWGVKISTN